MCKGKGERTECRSYKRISQLSLVRKIYARILVDLVHRVTECLTDNDQGGFRIERGTCRSDLHPKADRLKSMKEKVVCMWVSWIYGSMIGLVRKHYGKC